MIVFEREFPLLSQSKVFWVQLCIDQAMYEVGEEIADHQKCHRIDLLRALHWSD